VWIWWLRVRRDSPNMIKERDEAKLEVQSISAKHQGLKGCIQRREIIAWTADDFECWYK